MVVWVSQWDCPEGEVERLGILLSSWGALGLALGRGR